MASIALQACRHNLPGEAELVLKPTALNLAASLGQLGQIIVHFLLRIAAHDKRYGFSELEYWTAVERSEGLAVAFKRNGENAALGRFAFIDVVPLIQTAQVLENSEIKLDGLFSVRVEPAKRRNAREVLKDTY